MTDEERLKASIDQIYTYGGSQYTGWRVAVVKSIQKILLNMNEFYDELLPDLEQENTQQDIVHCQIRNGWFYEAVSQAEQSIEDLFSMMMNVGDLAFFAKKVIHYDATKVKKYIWNFRVDDLEYICREFAMPYFPLNEPWEKKEVFEGYKECIIRTQRFVKELQIFHKKYYLDYCQYKHGLSVALTPMQSPLMKANKKRLENVMQNPLENGLQTFHQGTVEQYEKRTGSMPAVGVLLKPGMEKHIRELHDEGNLLFFTVHAVDMNEVVRITEQACILLNTLWKTTIWRCEEKENDSFHRVAFPTDDIQKVYEIGFPKK